MPIGRDNPLPFRIGRGPTNYQKAYTFLKQAVGTGGSAKDEEGIEGLWRRSRARALALVRSTEERAANQHYPDLATDFLDYYATRLLAIPDDGSPEVERRAEAVERYTETPHAQFPELEAQLQRIDPRLSIRHKPWAKGTTTVFGRAFEAHEGVTGEPDFGGDGHSRFPNYASTFIVTVFFDLGYQGRPNAADARIVQRVKERLRDILPSVFGFRILTKLGFTLPAVLNRHGL